MKSTEPPQVIAGSRAIAARLGISQASTLSLIRQKALPVFRLGRHAHCITDEALAGYVFGRQVRGWLEVQRAAEAKREKT